MSNGVFGRFFTAQPAEEEIPETGYEQDYGYEDSYEDDHLDNVTELHRPVQIVEQRMSTCRPRNVDECGQFVPELIAGTPVILDISSASDREKTRIYDFACGVVAGCNGQFSMVTQEVFVLAPESVTISKLSE
ncbi:MAG: cell division protein SepF [Buchananella hordeovulneris]|nr:cell division protein SepF [Buchananella hordeovulneris]